MEQLATHERKRKKTDLVHLRALPSDEPDTSTGRVVWLWPEIQAALATGRTVREIWEAAQRDGMDIAYPQFRVYLSRLRRRQTKASAPAESRRDVAEPAVEPETRIDPLRNIRIQLEKKRQSHFEYNPFPDPKDSLR